MLNTGDILTAALGRQHDTSSELRAKALVWLNEAIQILAIERNWQFLEQSADLDIAGNSATLPDDFDSLSFLRTDDWYLKKAHYYTAEEAEFSSEGDSLPHGFTLSGAQITLLPSAPDGEATLSYIATVPDYADNVDTIIPRAFGPILARSVLSGVYEYETDQRTVPSIQLNDAMLHLLKRKDQRSRPIPKRSAYLRGRA